jgi:DNA-binding beta-propeller fold protein YncE
MTLQPITTIDLPEHIQPGGFDHAAVHAGTDRLYVAHTINNSIDMIDCATDLYLASIPALPGVAGVLVSEPRGLVFTSNRIENKVGIFVPGAEQDVVKVPVGTRPNGLAFDPQHGLLLVANVGRPEMPRSFTLSIVDVEKRKMIHSIPVPGRTRWAVFDPLQKEFYVNIADPASIAVVAADHPGQVARTLQVPATGPHGLDLDPETGRLYCACDDGKLICLQATNGQIIAEGNLSGKPDVIFLNSALHHLYVAIGDPGLIDVLDSRTLIRLETIFTGPAAHTLAFDARRNKLYVFLPETHQAQVFADA